MLAQSAHPDESLDKSNGAGYDKLPTNEAHDAHDISVHGPSDTNENGANGANGAGFEVDDKSKNEKGVRIKGNTIAFPPEWKIVEKHRVFPFGNFTKIIFHDGEKEFEWNARHHRKGRNQPKHLKRKRRFMGLDYWDISWWSAMTFTVGSLLWVFNGIVIFNQPFASLQTTNVAAAVSAFFGGLFFFFGGFFFYWEGLNIENHANFGTDLRKEERRLWSALNYKIDNETIDWKWIGWRYGDLGFLANFLQFCGTTIFFYQCCGWTCPITKSNI